jgi:translation initiation factor 1
MSDTCSVCGLPKEICVCEEIAKEGQELQIFKEKRRYGKTVTVVSGMDSSNININSLITDLKKSCACGGTLKEHKNTIELQGDHISKVRKRLEEKGFKVKG